MENGVQAIKIAFGMLIFVLAISITISAFTQASQAMQRIWEMQQADESFVTDADGNFFNYVDFEIGTGTRVVGVETIVPNMYRAYKENFTILFYKADGDIFELYEKDEEAIHYVDLLKESYATPTEAILALDEKLGENELYEKLAEKPFTEYLGEYFQEDVRGETGTAEVNKTKKRVIVYVQR